MIPVTDVATDDVAGPSPATDAYGAFRDELIGGGLLLPTAVDGLYGKSGAYQRIVEGLQRQVTLLGDGRFEEVHFPPVLPRATFDLTGYLQSFPDLMGSVHVFQGDDRAHRLLWQRYNQGEDWQSLLDPAEVVLCSAACHAIYPLCRGTLPEGGRRFDINGYCFRHEPSPDPARMQSFRMHELVLVGAPDEVRRHRDDGLRRGLGLLGDLGLAMDAVAANDPFFGRFGVLKANQQLEDALKIEGVTPICSEDEPTAIMSANYAEDHFGTPFGITTPDGQPAHSACVAFGLDRITLALLHAHGLDIDRWPADVRCRLWP